MLEHTIWYQYEQIVIIYITISHWCCVRFQRGEVHIHQLCCCRSALWSCTALWCRGCQFSGSRSPTSQCDRDNPTWWWSRDSTKLYSDFALICWKLWVIIKFIFYICRKSSQDASALDLSEYIFFWQNINRGRVIFFFECYYISVYMFLGIC